MIEALFAWDDAKSARNRGDRGFGFDYASRIFAGPVLEEQDRRKEYGEPRVVATGEVGEDMFVIV